MKVSDAIAKTLLKNGVKTVFGYQGGSITHMIDSFEKMGIQYIQNYNEQGASIAAEAYSRVCAEGIGAAIGTNGPGATNMITGIANAYCDSIPVLFLTGQVHSFAMKGEKRVRQESFQEIDIISIVRSITKYAVTVTDKNRVLQEIDRAIKVAKEGRPGPVLVDLPVDIQGEDIDFDYLDKKIDNNSVSKEDIDNRIIEKALEGLYNSKRPLVIAGGGIRLSKGVDLFRNFINITGCPSVLTLMGLDSLDASKEEYVGFVGGYGNRYANLAVQSSDYILALGTRLDQRQTGKRRDLFASNATIVHVDIDENELGHFIDADVRINVNLEKFLRVAIEISEERGKLQIDCWKSQIEKWKEDYSDIKELKDVGLNPNLFLKKMSKYIASPSVVCCDVGQNQMWSAQSVRIKGECVRILNSGGLGTMGFALPAAIGAYYASPNSEFVAIMGDGGLQMNIQELQLIGSKQIPIVMIIMNNHSLGLIRDIHEKYYNNRCIGSVDGFSMPDLRKLAETYNICYDLIDRIEDIQRIEYIFQNNKPYIVEVDLGDSTYVKPELLGNDGLDRQIPYING